MSHSLNSFLNTVIHKASDVSKNGPLVKGLCYTFVDEVAPGLGKKQKAKLASDCVDKIKQYALAGKRISIKSLRRIVPDVVENNLDFDVIKALPYNPGKMAGSKSNGTSKSGSSSGPTTAIGGSTTYAPVSVSHNVRRSSKPKMSMRGDAIIVRHSEMLGAIVSGAPSSNVTAYRCFGLRANPGLTSIFPWLSTMAVNYEKYRFRSLRFTLVPLVATSFSGRIGVGFDYDSSDVAPGNRQEFYALTNHAESMPWQATSINVKCDNVYRFTGTHVAADNKLIDQGQVILMSDSISGGTISSAIPLYDLIVDYEVELIEPQQSLFASQLFQTASLTVGNTLGLGSDTTTITGPTVVNSIVVTSGTVLTLNMSAGNYTIALSSNWSAGAATATVATATSGATVRTKTVNGSNFVIVIATLTATSDAVVTVTVGTVAWGTSQNAFDLIVGRCTSAVATSFVP